jgi:hypothetical protein
MFLIILNKSPVFSILQKKEIKKLIYEFGKVKVCKSGKIIK